MRPAALAILLLLAAGRTVAAQETGVLAKLTATRVLTPPELEQTAAVLRDRVARIGFHATVVPSGDGLVLRAPEATDLGPLGPALAQRGVLRLWWAVPFTSALPQDVPAGTLATWLTAPAGPDNRPVALALPPKPAIESPRFTRVSATPPDPGAIPSLTLTLDAPGHAAVAAARRPGTVLTLTMDDEVLAVSLSGGPGDAVTIDRAQVGFFGRSLPAIIRSGPLPARLVVDSARFLGDSPTSGLIFANPPQPVRQRLSADPAVPSAALPTLAASLQAALGRLAIWGAHAAPDGTGSIRLTLDDRRDLAVIPALAGSPPSWHWGRFELPGAPPQPGGLSTLGVLPALDGERLRLEDAAALRPDDVIAAEIIRPADENDGTTITLALELRPGAAGMLREQFRARGGLRLFAVLDGRARQGPFAPTLTADNRLLLRSLFDRKELWPTVAPIVRQGMASGVRMTDGP